MRVLLEDLRFTLRSLRKSPGFTSLVVLTLGLGIGFNTAIYSIISTYLFRPLPVREPGRLVVLATRDKHADVPHGLSLLDYRDYRRLTAVFADVLARREWPVALNWKNGGPTERLWADAVTENYFAMLGVGASAGRSFVLEETRTLVAVLDYECWRQKFGGDRGILGTSINLGGRAFTIIGIAPEGFQGTQISLRPDVYVPLETLGAADPEQRDRHELRVIARLRPGVSIAQAAAAVNLLSAQLERQYPDTNKGVRVMTIAERFARPEPQVSQATPAIAVFSMAVVGLVLVIACVNVANLLLARGIRRGREMAMRVALGAGRMRIVRLLLAESLVLGLCGARRGCCWLISAFVCFARVLRRSTCRSIRTGVRMAACSCSPQSSRC
jgi:putative ABC transport system permease protein